ncbi:MAG TPA: hypothetical protein VLD16_14900 [Gaiellaceae bacterium]|nr:hypothetical protein [Gaiellaceae bacterium]
MSVGLAHPAAALLALAGLLPLAVAAARARRARRLRGELGLAEPRLGARLLRPALLAGAFALLGLALAQPSLERRHEQRVRRDAQLLVALDSSRSMLAAPPGGASRAARATAFARRLGDALPDVPAGVASLSNRLVPYLFPTPDRSAYGLVLAQAYGVQRPPPALDLERNVTSFDALRAAAASGAFFSRSARQRILVVLSDAETRPFAAAGVLTRLRRADVTPVVVRFWSSRERIVHPDGTTESYRPGQAGESRLLRRAGWSVYPERRAGAAVAEIRRKLGTGPLVSAGSVVERTSIAPAVALAALAPLLLVLVPAGLLPARRAPQASA